MASQYKILHPVKYYRDYLTQKIRPDGRELMKHRPAIITTNSIGTADGSAIVKFGNTTVICGIKAELVQPKSEEPTKGFVVANVELPPLCSSKFRPGPPSEEAQVASQMLSDILNYSACLDLTQLCISTDKLCWVLYCDLVCLDHDGCLLDACVTAIGAALQTVQLPAVEYDVDTEVTVVVEDRKKSVVVNTVPVSSTFMLFEDEYLLADPTSEEEALNSAHITVVTEGDLLCSVHKPGGTPISEEVIDKCIKEAMKRGKLITKMVNTALKDNKIKN